MRSSVASSSLAPAVIASSIQAASWGMCSSVRPRVVSAGVPRRMPDGSKGLRESNGTELKFSSMPARSRALAAGLPAIPFAVRSTSSRWLSVPPDTRSKPWSSSAAASAFAFATTCAA